LLSNFSLSEYTKIVSAEASPQNQLGSLQRSPRYPRWFQGGCFAAEGEWREGEGRTRGGEEGKGGERGEWERGKLGG